VDFSTKFLVDFALDDDMITAAHAPPMGATAAYVMRHVDRIRQTSHARHIYVVDNYYTSLTLAGAVREAGSDLIGTLRKDRGAPTCTLLPNKKPGNANRSNYLSMPPPKFERKA
jgi:hypothetical protein